MPSRQEVSYFGAGPAPLPTPVVEAGAKAFVNFNDSGLGLGEISHRSPTANKILDDTKAHLSTLLDIPDNYDILFMQAGGSGEFSAVVQNLVSVWVERRRRRAEAEILQASSTSAGEQDKDKARVEELVFQRVQREVDEELKLDYLVTGSWSQKAVQEAQRLVGAKYVNVALDARKANGGKFGRIPDEKEWALTPTKREGGKGSAFVYFCDNETVDGVEFQEFPKSLESQGGEEEEERRGCTNRLTPRPGRAAQQPVPKLQNKSFPGTQPRGRSANESSAEPPLPSRKPPAPAGGRTENLLGFFLEFL